MATKTHWSDFEIRHFMEFVAEKAYASKSSESFLCAKYVCLEYLKQNDRPSERSYEGLSNALKRYLTYKIDALKDFEISDKVMMLYKLGIAPEDGFLRKMRRKADVTLNDVNQITYYAEHKEGGLELGKIFGKNKKVKSQHNEENEEPKIKRKKIELDLRVSKPLNQLPPTRNMQNPHDFTDTKGSPNATENANPRDLLQSVKTKPVDKPPETTDRSRINFTKNPEDPRHPDTLSLSKSDVEPHEKTKRAEGPEDTTYRQPEQSTQDATNSRKLLEKLLSLVANLNGEIENKDKLKIGPTKSYQMTKLKDVSLAFETALRVVLKEQNQVAEELERKEEKSGHIVPKSTDRESQLLRNIYQLEDYRLQVLQNRDCIFCENRHKSDKCPLHTAIDVRKEIIERKDLCSKCINPLPTRDEDHNCKNGKGCTYCRGNHHSSICSTPRTIIHPLQKGRGQQQSHSDTNKNYQQRNGLDPCPFCGRRGHYADECRTASSYEERMKIVENKSKPLCKRCLKVKGNHQHYCQGKRSCFHCRREEHHSALCVGRDRKRVKSQEESSKEIKEKRPRIRYD